VLAMTQVDGQIWAACNDKKIRIFNTKVDAHISRSGPFPGCRLLFFCRCCRPSKWRRSSRRTRGR
jgi:hypothetical protein